MFKQILPSGIIIMKYVENSEEKIHVDIGALWCLNELVLINRKAHISLNILQYD